MRYITALVAAVTIAALATGCGSDKTDSSAAAKEVANITDCAALQKKLDSATADHEIATNQGVLKLMNSSASVMKAANNRMDDIGC
jgi:hypothetical protein